MKVAVIGAGFSGLTVAYRLAKLGVDVSLFDADENPGGLAVGFKEPNWEWTLERHYHHLFTNDYSILNLAKEVGHKVIVVRPKTSTFIDGEILQLDSPLSLLLFSKIPFFQRIRMGAVLAYLKLSPSWKFLEKITAKDFIRKSMGKKSWEILWGPLFDGKFHDFSSQISASWFWARIKKRTSSLAYPEGGFLALALSLDKVIRKNAGKIFYGENIQSIKREGKRFLLTTKRDSFYFDKVVSTLTSHLFVKITQGLPKDYVDKIVDLESIGAVNLVLSLKKQFLEDGTYWLNINAKHFPFISVIEHTNFMDKRYYNNEHLIYIGNYLPHNHPYFQKNAGELLLEFFPFLTTINPKFSRSWINRGYVFEAPFAQPIITLNYSRKIPSFKTPIRGLYLCNIQQVYPWDRGTNYAVENAERVVRLLLNEK